MKIAFYNMLGEMKNGEQQTLMRLQYVFSKQGHTVLIFNKDGYVISKHPENGLYVEETNIDYLFTCNGLEHSLIAMPDVFSVFLHWAPLGFFENYKALLYMKAFHLFDYFAYSSEKEVFTKWAQMSVLDIPLFGPSVPEDYTVKPRHQKERKLFYIGINFERALANMRYGELLKELDKSGRLEIYGPRKVYGRTNLWSGFRSYCGEIPFDGSSIMKKINQAGVCLALNSPMHNNAGAVTNRTYEAAAAGAVIISDDNKFVRTYFGDSVFYIDQDMTEKEASKKILDILDWVNENPEKAYEMACRSQTIFLKNLSLDKMVSNFTCAVNHEIAKVQDITNQKDMIDIICFLETQKDYSTILKQLSRQYYQNLHLIIVADSEVNKNISVPYPYDVIIQDKNRKGCSFIQAKQYLKGRYFLFADRYSVLHARHIYKNYQVLSQRQELFAYSGCYLKTNRKRKGKYIVLNNRPISRNEFLLFSNDWVQKQDRQEMDEYCISIRVAFSRSAGLFRKEILDLVEDEELHFIPDAVQYYLACCSLVKRGIPGAFTYALTTGYAGTNTHDVAMQAFEDNRKSGSITEAAEEFMRTLKDAFFKYTFEEGYVDFRGKQFIEKPI